MTELVVALLMIVHGEIKEARIQTSMSANALSSCSLKNSIFTLLVIFISCVSSIFSTDLYKSSIKKCCSWSVGTCSDFLSKSFSNNSRDVSNDTNLAVSSVYANTPIATSTIRLATVFIGICTLASSPMFNGLLLILQFYHP